MRADGNFNSIGLNSCAAAILISLGTCGSVFSQATYTQQLSEYDRTNGASSGGIYNNGSTEVGMWMNGDNTAVGNVAWKTFRVGSGTGNTARSLQVGDTFRITLSTRGVFYGSVGASLNTGNTFTSGTFGNRLDGSRIAIIQNGGNFGSGGGRGAWFTAGSTSPNFGITPDSVRRDYSLYFTVTSHNTANVRVTGGPTSQDVTLYDIVMNGTAGANISNYSIWLSDDRSLAWDSNSGGRGDTFWKQTTSVTAGGAAVFGGDNGTRTISGRIADGLSATSASTANANKVFKIGSGTVTLSDSGNSYTGGTQIEAGTLAISEDGNLGTAPGSATAGSITIWSTGTLRATGTMTLNSNRGVALGDTTGPSISVDSGATLTYGGIMTGAANWNKKNSGILRLTSTAGENTGKVDIQAGTVQITGDRALGAVPGSAGEKINIWNNGTFEADGTFTLGSNRSIVLGSVAGPKISVTSGNTLTYGGQISGSANWSKENAGTLELSGTSTVSGATTVAGGALLVSCSMSSSAVTVNSGATIAGAGTVGNLIINGVVSPGNSAGARGTLNASAVNLGAGGSYTFDISNVSGTAGTDWDRVLGSGAITVNSAGTFTINLTGNPTGFSAGSSYAWTIMSGSSISGFNAARFAVNTNGFTPTPNGTFSVAQSGSNIQLVYSPAPTVTASTFAGTVGVAFNESIIATQSPTSYAVSSGTLPGGLSLNTTTGAITGTPTAAASGTTVQVTASNAAGTSSAATITFNIAKGTQAAVTGSLSSTTATVGGTITVTASGGSGSGAYEFRQATAETSLITVAASGNPRTITANSAGTATIEVRRVADANYNDSAWASAGTLTISAAATAPAAPTSLSVTPGDQQLSIAFTAASDGGAAITNFEYSFNNSTWTAFSPAGTTSPVVITGLTNGTAYTVYLRAVNSVGAGTASIGASGTPRTTPGAPTIGTITPGDGQLSVAFTSGSDGGSAITDYKWSIDGTSYTTRAGTASPIVITGLSNGTAYTVGIRAVNAAGDGTVATAGTTATPSTTPGTPTSIAITPGNAQLSVAFTAPSNGGSAITDYEYSTDGGTSFKSGATTSSPITITTVSASSVALVNGTSYNVQIRAKNANGVGSATSSTTGTPRTAPGAPTIGMITAGNGQLSVAFTAPASDGGSAITDYKWSVDGTNYTLRTGTASPIVITGLSNGTAYTVHIRAVNAAGDGTVATAGTTATPITTPTVTTGSASGVGSTVATLGGNITALGGIASATERGIFYSTTSGFADGAGTKVSATGTFSTGAFTQSVSGLSKNTTYYFKAFAVNSAGTSYGSQGTFTTANVPDGRNAISNTVPTTGFLGDAPDLYIRAWQSWNSNNRSFATVFGRFDNAVLTSNTTQGAGRNPGSADADFYATAPRFTQTGTFYWAMRVSYGSGNDFFFDRSMSDWSPLATTLPSTATLSITISALNNPTGQSATAASSSSISLAWSQGVSGNAKPTMIVRSTDNNFTAPTQGQSYIVGDTSLGGDRVVFNGIGTTATDTGLSAGTTYYYRFYSENNAYYSSGADANTTTTASPSITIGGATSATTTAFTTTYGTASDAQTFSIAGSNLAANITATAPTGFQVSSDGSTYGSTVTFTQSSGSASGTLYVRLAASAPVSGTYNSQNIALTSTDATTRNVTTASTGNAVSRKSLGITVAAQSITYGFPVTNNASKSWNTSVVAGGIYSVNNSDLVNGDTSSVVTGTASYSTTYVQGDAAGTTGRTITVSGLSASNYTLNAIPGNVTINTLNNPTGVTAASGGTNSINLTHNMTNSINVLVVRKQGSAVTWDPTPGTTYTDNQDVGTGHVVIKGTLSGNSSSDSGLSPNTTYHYKAYSEYYGYYSAGATTSATTDPLPPSVSIQSGTLGFGRVLRTSTAAEQSYTVSGSNLTANLTITAPAGFEVSTTSGSGFSSSVTLTPTSGSISSTTIYVRYSPTADGAQDGNITHTSAGLTTANKAVTGSGRDLPGGANPTTANATTAFVGDIVSLNVGAWKTWNDLSLVNRSRSFATVFGRFDNSDLSVSANCVQGAGRDPGSSADEFFANTPVLTQAGVFYWAMRVSYGFGNDFWFDAARADWSMLSLSRPSAATLSIVVSALNNPSALAATAVNTNQVNLTWTKGVSGGEKDTLILRNTSNSFTDPTPGTSYAAGANIGTATVIYKGNGTNFSDSNLSTGTQYFYKVYAENNSYYSSSSSGTVTASATTPSPSITVSGSLAAVDTTYGSPSASPTSFTVAGSYLAGNLTVTAPSGFEISTLINSGYANSFELTPSSGTIASTSVYLRLASTTGVGTYFGNVTVSGGGATTANVATVASLVSARSLAPADINLTRSGDTYEANSSGVSGFTLSYAGRTANGIATSYSASATAPTAPGYYTVTATSSDANYNGSKSENYSIAGPVAVDETVSRPTATMNIPRATLLQNDKRIDANGDLQTNNLSITAVAAGTGSPTIGLSNAAFVSFSPGGSGTETFTYTLTDSVTSKTATGTVTVVPLVWDNAFAVTGTKGSAVYADGFTEVTLTFSGTPNVTYQIQYKGELSDAWKNAGGWYSNTGSFEVLIQEEGDHAADWNGSMFFQGAR